MSIEEVAAEVGRGLQHFELRVQDSQTATARIRFPRGVIRTRNYYVQANVPFLTDSVIARNIAYTFQATDINRWVVNRFDLDLSARSLFYKQACITMVSAMEAVLTGVWHSLHPERSMKRRLVDVIEDLVQEGVLSRETAVDLHEVRRARNDIHLQRVTHREWNTYNVRDYNRVVLIEHRMLEELRRGTGTDSRRR